MLRFAKKIVKNVIYRPKLSALGSNSYVKRPHTLINPDRISVGNEVLILEKSVIQAIKMDTDAICESEIIIEDHVYIGRFCELNAINSIKIGKGTVLSDHVYMTDASHGFDPRGGYIMEQPLSSKGPIVIGQNCFIGLGTFVQAGVHLGDWCIVGAHSVVTKSFPAFSMITGNPAKIIKIYRKDKNEWEKIQFGE